MLPTLTLAATAFSHTQLLNPLAPQLALAGRSNVGKSSLVNALSNRKQLAKTSATPGKTRSINYFTIQHTGLPCEQSPSNMQASEHLSANSNSFSPDYSGLNEPGLPPVYLVDLPGYGYARCSKEERNKWAKLLEFYLGNTVGLKGVALLLDSRLSPQPLDVQMAEFTRAIGLPLIPVLTKTDKPRAKDLAANRLAWQNILRTDQIISCSAVKRQGLEELWAAILSALAAE